MRSSLGVLLGSLLVLTMVVPQARAEIAGSVTLTWPATVTTVEEFKARVVIVNESTFSNDTENVMLTRFFITPSCAADTNAICLPPNLDPFIFGIFKVEGVAETPLCAGIQFTRENLDPVTGEMEFSPDRPITLGPASGPLESRACQIEITLDASRVPRNPTGGTSGMTNTLARVTLRGVTTGLNGGGSGSTHFTVVKAIPAMSTTTDPSTLAVLPGQSVTDSASVQGGATGTVTFFLCQPNEVTPGRGCVSGGTQVGAVKELRFVFGGVPRTATSDAASGASTTTLGQYCWRAEYSGNDAFNATSHTDATSECFTVVNSPSTVTLQSNPTGNVLPITSVIATAMVTGRGATPSGTARFFLCVPGRVTTGGCESDGFSVGPPSTLNASGQAISDAIDPRFMTTLGTYCWRVEYSGDPNNASASHTDRNGACFTVVQSPPPPRVNQIPTLSEWVMIVLAGFVALVGVAHLHKRTRVERPVS